MNSAAKTQRRKGIFCSGYTRWDRRFLCAFASLRRKLFSGMLDDDPRELGTEVLFLFGQLAGHAPRDVAVDLREAPVRLGHDRRLAAVRLLAGAGIERDGAGGVHGVRLGHAPAAG